MSMKLGSMMNLKRHQSKSKAKGKHQNQRRKAHSLFLFLQTKKPVFMILGLVIAEYAAWDGSRTHVWWKVPNDLVENMMKHHHVWSGRIIKAEDD